MARQTVLDPQDGEERRDEMLDTAVEVDPGEDRQDVLLGQRSAACGRHSGDETAEDEGQTRLKGGFVTDYHR
ncbi:hypothetical protein [Micromonospora taraxaci]|uniref:hypothetical protein n=1 Tax=Micromonospora taraxaci TaxID=1316803 RepID=UPI0033B0DE0A